MRISLRPLPGRPLGPGEKAVAVLACLLLIAGVVTLVTVPDWGGKDACPRGVQRVEGACMGISAGEFHHDPGLTPLLRRLAEQNADAADEGAQGSEGRDARQRRRVALTMPFSSDETSAVPLDLLRHGLAGALAAQRAANARSGPKLELLLADLGKDMKNWEPVVRTLGTLPGDGPPLIATVGLPSSTSESRQTIEALADRGIPSIGPVITSSDMNAGRYFFKTSPSNEHFTDALRRHLDAAEDSRRGFLVLDERAEDTYSRDLEKRVLAAFGDRYELKRNSASYVGTRGDEAGTPNLFRIPVLDICASKSDTVFYAGRDEDLPALVERLTEARCGYGRPLRIVKVGIGMPPQLTGETVTKRMHKAGIRLVNAAAYDPAWQRDSDAAPPGFDSFRSWFERTTKGIDLGDEPLDDGYAAMYHDAVRAVAEASGLAYEDTSAAAEGKENGRPSAERVRKDVHNKLLNLNPDSRGGESGCDPCIEGAAGTYGFNPRTSPDLWPVCKSVHIVEHPEPEGGGKRPEEPYRTYGKSFSGKCPPGP